jgi:hypothetical protein
MTFWRMSTVGTSGPASMSSGVDVRTKPVTGV